MQRNDADASLCIRLGILLLKLTRDEVHLGLCLLSRDALLEPAKRVKKVVAAVRRARVDSHRHPHVDAHAGWELQCKSRRHHAAHSNRAPVEREALEVRIGIEESLPQIVTDDYRVWSSRCFFFGKKGAPEHRLNAE